MSSHERLPPEISDRAAKWVTDRDAGLFSETDEAELAAWLAADPRHIVAFERAEKLWRTMGGGQVKAKAREVYATDLKQSRRLRRFSRRFAGPALAASVAVAVVVAADLPTRLSADALTATGERRTIALDDGSRVDLDTASAIAVDFRADRRVVRLLRGAAAFSVTADSERPFTVEANEGATTALGTRFTVRLNGADTAVAVTEHRVRVAWPAEHPGPTTILSEGNALTYGPDGLGKPHRIDPVAAEAWTKGNLVFVDRPLQEVVADLNRYHPGYIRVIGENLRKRRISGVFRSDDPLGALATLGRTLGIRETQITNRLIFLHK